MSGWAQTLRWRGEALVKYPSDLQPTSVAEKLRKKDGGNGERCQGLGGVWPPERGEKKGVSPNVSDF